MVVRPIARVILLIFKISFAAMVSLIWIGMEFLLLGAIIGKDWHMFGNGWIEP